MLRLEYPALHPVFETLAYGVGFALYRRLRRDSGDVISESSRWTVIAAAVFGALVGSRLLGLLSQGPRLQWTWHLLFAPGGKTIVGGLLGGWLAVEVVKRVAGVRARTGDLFALPLCVGIAVGRIGCLLAGLPDDTYGTPTRMPWGVDFGDGIARHPTQAYEIVFLSLLALVIWRAGRRPHREGSLFRLFMAGYLAWRFGIDFLKPQPAVLGLQWIQWAALLGLLTLFADFAWTRRASFAFAKERVHV